MPDRSSHPVEKGKDLFLTSLHLVGPLLPPQRGVKWCKAASFVKVSTNGLLRSNNGMLMRPRSSVGT